jgi:hypothetical protein
MVDGTRRAGTIAWLVALVVPPVVVGGLGQRFVAQHTVWAVLLGGAYEAVIAVVGFFAVIAGKVSSRWQDRLADRIDLFLQRKGPRFERWYRRFVLAGLRFTDTKGLATVGPFTPEHDKVFVDVSLVPRPPQQIKPGILPELAGNRPGRRVLGDFLRGDEPVVLAVVGGPGSGKTTLLRHAARQACLLQRSWKDRRQVRDVPVLLYLRDHAARIVAEPAVSVAALLRSTLGDVGVDEPPGWFEQQLAEGRCLVLLDGLDEVARPDDRAKVSAWAEAQVRRYSGSSFVISSRPRGYESAPVGGADIVQVCGLTTGQVEDFVGRWYLAEVRHSTGTAGPEADALAVQGAADLLQRLKQTPALYDLAVNPLLLTMIVNVHKYRGALPGSRVSLYSEICLVMLGRRQEAKQLDQQLSGDQKEVILRGLAYAMMDRHAIDLSRADVLAEVQPALRRISRDVTPGSFLADASSNGLLIERETGQFAFAHKTIQEYLAAEHIREHTLASVLADAVSDDWWAETTLLYAAKSNADLIVRACLDDGSAPALALALDCADQGGNVDPGLREYLEALGATAAQPDADPERRRLFASILLRRYTRQHILTSAGSQICLRPIPADIYRLFLADTMTPKPDAPMEKIAVGMRGGDASALVRWANGVSDGQRAYRLPLAAELTELAPQHPIPDLPTGPPTVWVQADHAPTRTPVLWLAPGAPNPHQASNVLLASAIAADAKRSASALSGLLLLRARVLIYVLNRALDHARDHDHALDLNLAREFARDLDKALDLARDRELAHALDADALGLAREIAQARDQASGRAQASELAQAREIAQARDRELARARDGVQEKSYALSQARSTAGARGRALAQARVQARRQARERDREIAQTRDRAQARALTQARAQAKVQARNRERDLESARAYAETQVPIRSRELAQARAQANAQEHARDLAHAHVGELALALDLAQACDRDRIFDLTREFDRTCTLARTRVLSHALDLDDALKLARADDLDRALDLAPADDLARAGDLARYLARDRRLARELNPGSVLDLAITINEAADRHALWRSLRDSVLPAFDDAFGFLLGQIFSMTFTEDPALAIGSPAKSASWTTVVTKAFTAAAISEPTGQVAVNPEALGATLNDAVNSLTKTLERSAEMPRAWPAIVAERLELSAGPVFARDERPTTGKATVNRLAALCLASEADGMERTDIGDMFRQVAAGITLLERRATNQWPASETIMLAVEQTPFGAPVSRYGR